MRRMLISYFLFVFFLFLLSFWLLLLWVAVIAHIWLLMRGNFLFVAVTMRRMRNVIIAPPETDHLHTRLWQLRLSRIYIHSLNLQFLNNVFYNFLAQLYSLNTILLLFFSSLCILRPFEDQKSFDVPGLFHVTQKTLPE